MRDPFLKLLKNEWNIVTGAPLSFMGLILLSIAIAYAASRWRYIGIVETLKEKLSFSKDRISAKDQQLDEYRERLHLVPAHGSQYSKHTHAELKERTLKLVADIREWFSESELKTRKTADVQWNSMVQAKTEEEKQKLWNLHTNTRTQGYFNIMADFEKKFKVDTILLRDEMNSRLPEELKKESESTISRYEHPVNTFCIKEITDDLERKAKQLF